MIKAFFFITASIITFLMSLSWPSFGGHEYPNLSQYWLMGLSYVLLVISIGVAMYAMFDDKTVIVNRDQERLIEL